MGVHSLVRMILAEVGINPERFALEWASAAEAPRFVKLITEFTAKVRELGPLGESEGLSQEELKARLEQALKLAESRKLRMTFGTTSRAIRKEGNFDREHIDKVVKEKLAKTVSAELGKADGA